MIVLVPDVKALENIRNLLNATGASKFIAEVQSIVIPKNMGQVMIFAEQVKPIAQHLQGLSKICAGLFEIEFPTLPQP